MDEPRDTAEGTTTSEPVADSPIRIEFVAEAVGPIHVRVYVRAGSSPLPGGRLPLAGNLILTTDTWKAMKEGLEEGVATARWLT